MKSVLEPRKHESKELEGEERAAALKEFQSGSGWHRGAQASRLSEQEAGILAARLVRRVQEKEKLNEETARKLEAAITDIYKRRFIREPGKDAPSPQTVKDEIMKVGRELLDEKGVAALDAALAQGNRPQAQEK